MCTLRQATRQTQDSGSRVRALLSAFYGPIRNVWIAKGVIASAGWISILIYSWSTIHTISSVKPWIDTCLYSKVIWPHPTIWACLEWGIGPIWTSATVVSAAFMTFSHSRKAALCSLSAESGSAASVLPRGLHRAAAAVRGHRRGNAFTLDSPRRVFRFLVVLQLAGIRRRSGFGAARKVIVCFVR